MSIWRIWWIAENKALVKAGVKLQHSLVVWTFGLVVIPLPAEENISGSISSYFLRLLSSGGLFKDYVIPAVTAHWGREPADLFPRPVLCCICGEPCIFLATGQTLIVLFNLFSYLFCQSCKWFNNFGWNFIEVRGIWITSGQCYFNKCWYKIKFYLIMALFL